jgi:hypothetical protein
VAGLAFFAVPGLVHVVLLVTLKTSLWQLFFVHGAFVAFETVDLPVLSLEGVLCLVVIENRLFPGFWCVTIPAFVTVATLVDVIHHMATITIGGRFPVITLIGVTVHASDLSVFAL